MRRPTALSLPAPLAGLLVPTFATWALIAADIGWTQMSARGVTCGASAPHCAWCYAAAALGLASVVALVSAALQLDGDHAKFPLTDVLDVVGR